jgi:hypothetical protein
MGRRPIEGQKNSRAKALPGDPYLILDPRFAIAIFDCQRGGSVEPAPLDHPPKTWTAFPSADTPRRDRALATYSIFGPMSPPLAALSDKKILFLPVFGTFSLQTAGAAASCNSPSVAH